MRVSAADDGVKAVPIDWLSLGTLVVVMQSSIGSNLITNDGRPFGYVAEDGLTPVK